MKWNPKTKTPRRKGWYITMRVEEGYVSWRAWGNGEWWKQLSGGWIGWYDGDGNPYRCLWASKPHFSIEMNQNELPPVEDYTKPKEAQP